MPRSERPSRDRWGCGAWGASRRLGFLPSLAPLPRERLGVGGGWSKVFLPEAPGVLSWTGPRCSLMVGCWRSPQGKSWFLVEQLVLGGEPGTLRRGLFLARPRPSCGWELRFGCCSLLEAFWILRPAPLCIRGEPFRGGGRFLFLPGRGVAARRSVGRLPADGAPSAASLDSLDADVWKKFLSRPALPFILRLLRGLATQHPATQVRGHLLPSSCPAWCRRRHCRARMWQGRA